MAGLVVQPPSPAMILRAVASHSQATHPQRLQTESAAGRSQDPFDTMNLGVRTTTSCFDLCFLVVGGSLSNAGKTAITKNTKQHVDVYLQGTVYLYITMGSTYIWRIWHIWYIYFNLFPYIGVYIFFSGQWCCTSTVPNPWGCWMGKVVGKATLEWSQQLWTRILPIAGDFSAVTFLSPIIGGHLSNLWVGVMWTHHPKKVKKELPGRSSWFISMTFWLDNHPFFFWMDSEVLWAISFLKVHPGLINHCLFK